MRKWTRPRPPPVADVVNLSLIPPSTNRRILVYWPKEKQWFAGRVTRVTADTAEVRYDDGDTSVVEVGDQWKLESEEEEEGEEEEETARVQRGKVRWGSGTGTWYNVEKRAGPWVYVEGGLKVAKANLKTLVCVDEVTSELHTYGEAADEEMSEEDDEEEYVADDDEEEEEEEEDREELRSAEEEERAVTKRARPRPPRPSAEVVELDGDAEEEADEADEAAAKRRKDAARVREYTARQPVQRCGVDGCEFQTKQKGHLKQHQACVHGIGDVDAEELRRKWREQKERLPVQRCGVDGCEYQTKVKGNLKQHQASVHGIGDVEAAEELRRKAREYMARRRAQRK
jgi:hypothetical protein